MAFRMPALLFMAILGAVSASARSVRALKKAPPADLSPEGQAALQTLLVDLGIVSDGHSSPVQLVGATQGPPSKEEFMPTCLAHTKELIKTIDKEYTDVQLESVLVHDCELTEEFPHSHKSSFASHEACLEFAEKLTQCRKEELETGKDDCYTAFCADYHTHLTTEMQEAKKKEDDSTVERATVKAEAPQSVSAPAPSPKKEKKSWDDQPSMNPASWFSSAHRRFSAGLVGVPALTVTVLLLL